MHLRNSFQRYDSQQFSCACDCFCQLFFPPKTKNVLGFDFACYQPTFVGPNCFYQQHCSFVRAYRCCDIYFTLGALNWTYLFDCFLTND